MHLYHIWSVNQLLQLSHTQSVELTQLLLRELGWLLGSFFLRRRREGEGREGGRGRERGEGERKGERERGREGGREGWRDGGREGAMEGGRNGGREEWREGDTVPSTATLHAHACPPRALVHACVMTRGT